MRHDVLGHYRASAYHGEAAHGNTGQNHRSGPNRSSVLNEDLAYFPIGISFQLSLGGNGPRKLVVGQTGVWANKDAVFNRHAVVYGRAILYLDPVSDNHVQVYVSALANDARPSDLGTLSDLGLVPDFCPLSDFGQGGNLGCWMNLHMRC